MTDDRARRIRNLRNRNTRDRGDEDRSDDDGDEPVGTDGGDAAGDDGGADESDPGEPTEADTDEDDGDSNGPEDGDSSGSDVSEPDGADASEPDADDGAADGADDDATDTGSPDGSPAVSGESVEPAADEAGAGTEVTFEEATATDVVGSPVGGGPSTGHELRPMVDAEQASDSPFGGAIADESVLEDFVDDVGSGTSTEMAAMTTGAAAAGEGSMGRGTTVFERSDSLIASTHDDDTIQMLEFYLNEDRYALEIDRISAIVEMKEITRFPRGPEAIDGVTDLRGEITAVLDPTTMLDVERSELSKDHYIVVLERDDDKQKLGIRVTDVLQAVTYRESQIDETAAVMDSAEHQHEFVNGIIKKAVDDRTELVTWLDIDAIIENTE